MLAANFADYIIRIQGKNAEVGVMDYYHGTIYKGLTEVNPFASPYSH
jgi:hypothetical protein